jgi:hypothetical protein
MVLGRRTISQSSAMTKSAARRDRPTAKWAFLDSSLRLSVDSGKIPAGAETTTYRHDDFQWSPRDPQRHLGKSSFGG